MSSEDILRSGEQAAISGASGGFYRGSGRQASGKGGFFKSKKRRNTLMALLLSLGILGGGAAFLGSSEFTLVGALTAQVTNQLDNSQADANGRIRYLNMRILKGEAELSKKYRKSLESNDFTIKQAGKKYQFIYKDGTVITDKNFDEILNSNVEIRNAYQQSAKTKVLAFMDNSAIKNKQRYNITNNKLREYTQTGDYEENKKRHNDILAPDFENTNTTVGATSTHQEEVVDSEGNPVLDENNNKTYKEVNKFNDTGTSSKVEDGSVVSDVATSNAKAYINKVADSLGAVTDVACGILRVGSMLSAAVTGYQMVYAMNFAMDYLESYSKTQYGDGANAAVNVANNFFTTSTTEKVVDMSKVNPLSRASVEENLIEVTGSPLEAESVRAILTHSAPNLSSSLQKSLNLDRILLGALGSIGMTKIKDDFCEGMSVVQSTVSIILTAGISALITSIFVGAVGSAVANTVIGAALSFAIPVIGQVIFSNTFLTTLGIPGGETFALGAGLTNMTIGRNASAQVLATADYATKYAKATQEVIAQEAEVERYRRSPFDISSPYTFLGSIAHSLLPIFVSTRKNILTNTSSVVSKSIASITGSSVSAASAQNTSYLTTFGDYCKRLDTIGAAGTVLCGDITVSDLSTINLDVSEGSEAYETYIKPNLNDDGTIRKGSNLQRFIDYVIKRESPFGYADANIAADLDIIDIGGDIPDIVNGIHKLIDPDIKAWIYGDYGVICNELWGELGPMARWYADQERYLSWIGDEDKVSQAYKTHVAEYEAKHYSDTTFAGLLSRISGLSKPEAEFVIALGEYNKYLEEYDPSSLVALDEVVTHPTADDMIAQANRDKIFHDDSEFHATVAILTQAFSYTDLRNRNYLV